MYHTIHSTQRPLVRLLSDYWMKTSRFGELSLIDKVVIFRGEESLKFIPEIEALFA